MFVYFLIKFFWNERNDWKSEWVAAWQWLYYVMMMCSDGIEMWEEDLVVVGREERWGRRGDGLTAGTKNNNINKTKYYIFIFFAIFFFIFLIFPQCFLSLHSQRFFFFQLIKNGFTSWLLMFFNIIFLSFYFI